jgi:hypothetical protein
MKHVRTANQLIERLDDELAWRLQELVSIRRAIRNSSGVTETSLLRAAVPILYAHWEGFVKAAAIGYANFISTQGIPFGKLQRSFKGLRALTHVKQLHEIKRRIFVAAEIINTLENIDKEACKLPLASHISYIGNLDYDIFEQIVEFLSIGGANYTTRKQLIDETLLKMRNEIAHGEYLLIDFHEFEALSDNILEIMRQFKTDIQNAVVRRDYLRPSASSGPTETLN